MALAGFNMLMKFYDMCNSSYANLSKAGRLQKVDGWLFNYRPNNLCLESLKQMICSGLGAKNIVEGVFNMKPVCKNLTGQIGVLVGTTDEGNKATVTSVRREENHLGYGNLIRQSTQELVNEGKVCSHMVLCIPMVAQPALVKNDAKSIIFGYTPDLDKFLENIEKLLGASVTTSFSGIITIIGRF